MNLAHAQSDKTWGRWPCEGLVPSSHTCVSGRGVATRDRTQPGLGAACKGSNAADRNPCSYGGQHFRWPEQRRLNYVRERCSAPAAASQATFEVAVFIHCCSGTLPTLELDHGTLGMNFRTFEVSGGDPFTALELAND